MVPPFMNPLLTMEVMSISGSTVSLEPDTLSVTPELMVIVLSASDIDPASQFTEIVVSPLKEHSAAAAC